MLMCCGVMAYSQIPSRSIPSKPKTEINDTPSVPYDSLQNLTFDNFESLVGQTLYLKPSPSAADKGYYTLNWFDLDGGVYKGVNDSEYYYISNQRPSYHQLVGHYFDVVRVIVENKDDFAGAKFWLYLRDKETQEVSKIYFQRWVAAMSHYENFVVQGYFDKCNSHIVGNRFVCLPDGKQPNSKNEYSVFDVKSLDDNKSFYNIPKDSIFDVELTFLEQPREPSKLVCILHNSATGDLYVEYKRFHETFKSLTEAAEINRQSAEYRRELTRKYGKYNADLILARKVKIGFTKEMCEIAWGKPEKINTTITNSVTSEQWVYGLGTYLYFRNGKLTSIQD